MNKSVVQENRRNNITPNLYMCEGLTCWFVAVIVNKLVIRTCSMRPTVRTMTASVRIDTITALLKTKTKTYLIAHVENADLLLSNKLNIS